jgi:16S rRNA (cytidine1402-2'-O)-methyltransferase
MTIFHGQKINCGLPTIKVKFAAMDEININDSNLENSELTPLQLESAEGNTESNNTQLILVPLPIGENSWLWMNTPQYIDAITPIRHWVAEDARTLRRFLSSLKVGIPLNDLDIFELNTRTPQKELEAFLKDIQNTKLIGMASEAGMPCIADPGAVLVKIGHQRGWDIKPIMGPNSLMLALAGSGLSGQTFTFHGYPPINENELKQLTVLLNNKATDKHSHLFIETPYRTDRLLQFFCKNLPQDMLLCIAKDLQGPAEHILTQPISAWKRKVETLGKSPCVFIVGR